ncbi:helix-turn-helix domain-containing protein [Sphingobium sufflavum]|uniref:XRE family transcriptional regulator n=1 Tax=Sphingobium sufflavum TaxID=1129547 RepID=UPI001F1D7AFD|nr:XRE family transcriptional regulator [Sphingobium sufflavum]MCE7798698.1 helix-turn-helix domain-containing protein [Sphingobium sufflavum]
MAESETVVYDSRSASPAVDFLTAGDLHLRAGLLHGIAACVAAQDLDPAEISALIDIIQPSMSALIAGDAAQISIGMLLRALLDCGKDVEICIGPSSEIKGSVRVITQP